MSRLSISRAWDETKARLGSDGRLLATVALAMVALPSAISTLVKPESGVAEGTGSLVTVLIVGVMSLIAMVGQLAIIRLAIGPSVSVGDAIGHAARRALPYLGSIILLVIALLILAVPLVAVLVAMGMSLDEGGTGPLPAGAWIPILLFVALTLFVGVRMLMSSSVATAESAGPVRILKRSWELTRGHSGRLLGFLIMFLLAAIIVLGAIGLMVGLLARSVFGEVEPLSAAALLVGLVQGLASAAATAVFAVMLARIYVQLTGAAGGAKVSVPTSGT